MVSVFKFNNNEMTLLVNLEKVSRIRLDKLPNNKGKITIAYSSKDDCDSWEASQEDIENTYNNLIKYWE